MKIGDLVRYKAHGWTALVIDFVPFEDDDSGEGLCTIQWISAPESLLSIDKYDTCHSSMLETVQALVT